MIKLKKRIDKLSNLANAIGHVVHFLGKQGMAYLGHHEDIDKVLKNPQDFYAVFK